MRFAYVVRAAIVFYFIVQSASVPQTVPAQPRFNFDTTHVGRPPTEDEKRTLEDAINNIATPPPDSLTFVNDNGDTVTVSCWVIAYDLILQLHGGRMEVERKAKGFFWTLPDSLKSPDGDGMNVDSAALAKAADSANWMRVVEGCLVHEWWHKNQDTAALRNNDSREEVAPYNLMSAYYCSTATTPGDTNDGLTKWATEQARLFTPQVRSVRPLITHRVKDDFLFLKCDSAAIGGHDSIVSFEPGETGWHGYSLFPMRGSDLLVMEDSPLLPPEHDLVVVFGGNPPTGNAMIQLLDSHDGMILGPVWNHEFGLPEYPPMFFYSVTKTWPEGPWYVLDSLNHMVLMMQDLQFNDGVPDEITSVFANQMMPGMEPLGNARGLEAIGHPYLGQGVLVIGEDVHLHDAYYPHDWNNFLVDADGDLHADVMLPVPLYEFLSFVPIIQLPRPWPGDNWVNLFASWQHDIEIWSTNENGDVLIEPLGIAHMSAGVGIECVLSRPLNLGEWIMPRDLQTDKSPAPIQISAPSPTHLTIRFEPEMNMLWLEWDGVPGAELYAIWISDDGESFFDSGLRTVDSSFQLPLQPQESQFFMVKAVH